MNPLFFFIFLLLGLALIAHFIYYKKKQLSIKRWQKSLNLHAHGAVFQRLYHDSQGFILSQKARQGHDAMEYAYGEIEFLSFIALLSLVQPDENTIFYDLGSGTGKAVLACCMVFPVRKSIGIELFPELYLDACKRARQLATIDSYAQQAKKIKFILGNFLEVDLQDATLIFINSSAFFGPTWEKLCARLDQLSQLKTIITTSKILSCTHFLLAKRTKVVMSWGIVFAYIHKRKKLR